MRANLLLLLALAACGDPDGPGAPSDTSDTTGDTTDTTGDTTDTTGDTTDTPSDPGPRPADSGVGVRLTKSGTGSSMWTPWSVLLWRVFGVNGLACPTCGKVMVLRAEARPPATLSVLASLERSARGPQSGAQSAGTA